MREVLEAAGVLAIGILIGLPLFAVVVGVLMRVCIWAFHYTFPLFHWAASP